MDDWDEKYARIEEKNRYTQEKMRDISDAVDRSLAYKDISYVFSALSCFEDENFSMNADAKRICVVLKILSFELKYRKNFLFFFLADSYDDLIQRYIQTTLYMRRFNFLFDEKFIEESAHYFLENRISPETIITISEEELFVNRKELVISIYLFLKKYLKEDERAEWLCCLQEKYGDRWIIDEMKELVNNE